MYLVLFFIQFCVLFSELNASVLLASYTWAFSGLFSGSVCVVILSFWPFVRLDPLFRSHYGTMRKFIDLDKQLFLDMAALSGIR